MFFLVPVGLSAGKLFWLAPWLGISFACAHLSFLFFSSAFLYYFSFLVLVLSLPLILCLSLAVLCALSQSPRFTFLCFPSLFLRRRRCPSFSSLFFAPFPLLPSPLCSLRCCVSPLWPDCVLSCALCAVRFLPGSVCCPCTGLTAFPVPICFPFLSLRFLPFVHLMAHSLACAAQN